MAWLNAKAKREEHFAQLDRADELIETAQTEKRELTEEEYAEVETCHTDADKSANELRILETHEEKSLEKRAGRDALEIPETPRHKYSLLKAIRQMASKTETLDGLEMEMNDEIAHRYGKEAQGFYMPWNLSVNETRDLDTTTGSGAIPTITDTSMIDMLRNRMLVQQLGALVLGNMEGNFEIPKQTSGGSAYWISTEGGSPSASEGAIGQVAFSPSTIGAFTDITRKFRLQTSIDAELFTRQDLTKVMALEIDRAALNGSGSSNEPEGILQNSSVPTVALDDTNGGEPTLAGVVEMETETATSNADIGKLAYVTTAQGRGKLKVTDEGTDTGVRIWHQDKTVNSYPAFATNQMPADLTKGSGTALSSMIFGNWEDLVIAMWGGLDVLVDPYTGSTSGTVRVVLLQDLAIKLRNAESFSKIVDMITS